MRRFLRWLGIGVAAAVATALGSLFYLARRASKRTGKSIIASVSDVPKEAELLASEAKTRAYETVSASLKTARDQGIALKDRIPAVGRSKEEAESEVQETAQTEAAGPEESQAGREEADR